MEKVLQVLVDFFDAMTLRDKIMGAIYLLLFVPLGLMMKYGVIPYPQSVMEWLLGMAESQQKYGWYIAIFLAVQVANMVQFFTSVGATDGIVNLLKYSYDEGLTVVGSLLTIMVVVMVNIFMFPMFLVVYFAIGIGWAITSSSK